MEFPRPGGGKRGGHEKLLFRAPNTRKKLGDSFNGETTRGLLALIDTAREGKRKRKGGSLVFLADL